MGYYLSRMNFDGIKALGIEKQNVAFERIGMLLGRKPATIKNIRDTYDPKFNNGRVGWYQKPLVGQSKEVFDEMEMLSDEELIQLAKEIMDYYKEQNKKDGKPRIKITNYKVKEIKSRKN